MSLAPFSLFVSVDDIVGRHGRRFNVSTTLPTSGGVNVDLCHLK